MFARTLTVARAAAFVAFASLGLAACGAAPDSEDPTAEEGELRSKSAKLDTFVGMDGKTYFYLMAGNGERVLRSQAYTRLDSAKTGMESVRANGIASDSYTVLESKDGQFYFNLKAKNGEIIATSETYVSKSNADRAVRSSVALLKLLNPNPNGVPVATRAGFEVFKGEDGKYYFRLRAGNGEIVVQSQAYTAKASATKGIDSIKENGSLSTRYQVIQAADGLYYFHLKAGNGEIIGHSETYFSKSNADRAVDSMISTVKANPQML